MASCTECDELDMACTPRGEEGPMCMHESCESCAEERAFRDECWREYRGMRHDEREAARADHFNDLRKDA